MKRLAKQVKLSAVTRELWTSLRDQFYTPQLRKQQLKKYILKRLQRLKNPLPQQQVHMHLSNQRLDNHEKTSRRGRNSILAVVDLVTLT